MHTKNNGERNFPKKGKTRKAAAQADFYNVASTGAATLHGRENGEKGGCNKKSVQNQKKFGKVASVFACQGIIPIVLVTL